MQHGVSKYPIYMYLGDKFVNSQESKHILKLPNESKVLVVACLILQAITLRTLMGRGTCTVSIAVAAFFIGGLVTDWISGVFHFTFDYVWRPDTPIMGPIAVDFQEHHLVPTLDPSAVATNLTKGVYGALPLTLVTLFVTVLSRDTTGYSLLAAVLMATNLWMLGFHQIHAYAHMGSRLAPEDFKSAVSQISKLPRRSQRTAFARLFDRAGIPTWVRLLQRGRLFLRPEVHWQHHIAFETDFSSVNGWSDPMMNWLYRPLARRLRANQMLSRGQLSCNRAHESRMA